MTAEYKVHGDVAVITHEQPSGQRSRLLDAHRHHRWPRQGQCRRRRQGHRHHRRRQGVLGRRGHQGIRHAQGAARAQPAERDPCARSLGQAHRRGHPLGVHGRRPRAGPGLPLPRGRTGHQRRAARSQAGPDSRRRRHAAPAARDRRGNRAEHDRERRAREERTAREPARPEAVRQARGIARVGVRRSRGLRQERGRQDRPLPLVRNLPCKHPQGDAYFQFAKNMVKRHVEELPRAAASAWTPCRPPPRRSSTTAWPKSAASSPR
jgi:hypothetical protein